MFTKRNISSAIALFCLIIPQTARLAGRRSVSGIKWMFHFFPQRSLKTFFAPINISKLRIILSWFYGLVIGFIVRLYTQLVITSNQSAIANSHSEIHHNTDLSLHSLLCLHQSLSSSGFQRWTFPSSGFLNCLRASATSFSQQQLTTTEPHQSCN
jgi:hypothetical protein